MKPAGAAVFVAVLASALTAAPLTWSGGPAWNIARADEKADAQKLLDQGNRAAGEGDYLTALDRFQAAYARYKSPKLLLNIGVMLRQLGRNAEAAAVYGAYLRDPEADPSRAKDVRRMLGEIDDLVGRIRVRVNRPGATVRLDGRELTGLGEGDAVLVEPGEHTLVAEHPSYPSVVATVRVARREARVVELVLGDPGISQRTIGIVTGALGLAGMAAGGVAGVVAAVKNHAAASHCMNNTSCDAEGVSLGATAKTSATVSTAALAAGGGVLALGLVLYLTSPNPSAKPNRGAQRAFGFVVAVAGGGPSLRWEGVF